MMTFRNTPWSTRERAPMIWKVERIEKTEPTTAKVVVLPVRSEAKPDYDTRDGNIRSDYRLAA